MHGCETWSLTLREQQRLRQLENTVIRRIFGPEGGWRMLHNEKSHNLDHSTHIIGVIKEDEIGGACSTDGTD
jgi:hypothetical protein